VPAAVEALAQLLGVQPELDLLLLAELGRCASGQAPPFDSAVGSRVRGFLHAPSVELVREAAQACGRLEDAEALPELVELLGHENRGVRRNAHWSLRKITGVSFAEDPRAWGAWLLSEERWWDERAPELLLGLGDPDLAHALAAVQELARRRAPRHPLAREMVRALAHEEREVRRLACVALGQFRSRTAVPDLLAALEDPEADVRMAALRALRSITGLDLPGERAAWAKAGL
jgi:HEAT repeat protein